MLKWVFLNYELQIELAYKHANKLNLHRRKYIAVMASYKILITNTDQFMKAKNPNSIN